MELNRTQPLSFSLQGPKELTELVVSLFKMLGEAQEIMLVAREAFHKGNLTLAETAIEAFTMGYPARLLKMLKSAGIPDKELGPIVEFCRVMEADMLLRQTGKETVN